MPEMRKLSETEFREYSLSGNYYRIILKVGTPLAIFAFFNCVFSILDTVNDLQDKPEGLDMSVLSTDSVSGLPVAPHPYG